MARFTLDKFSSQAYLFGRLAAAKNYMPDWFGLVPHEVLSVISALDWNCEFASDNHEVRGSSVEFQLGSLVLHIHVIVFVCDHMREAGGT